MAEHGFLSRWSRLKAEARTAPQREPASAPDRVPTAADRAPAAIDAPAGSTGGQPEHPLPTLEDAMRLGRDSDYSAFVARGVDPSVRRHALRTLFSDPHFNVIDGLDVYMGDYTRSDPIPPAMLASLQHADAWLRTQLKDDDTGPAAPRPAAAGQQDQPQCQQRDHQPAQQGRQDQQDQDHKQDHKQDHQPDNRHGHQYHHQATALNSAPAREHDEH